MSEVKRDAASGIPVLFEQKEDCCGCGACFSICPAGAISMKEDSEGFDYPQIDPDLCVGCLRCLSACPMR